MRGKRIENYVIWIYGKWVESEWVYFIEKKINYIFMFWNYVNVLKPKSYIYVFVFETYIH